MVLAPADLLRVSAQTRSLSNVGFMLGAVIAGVAVPFGTRTAFCAVVLLTALAQAACTVIIWKLPVPVHAAGRRHGRASSRSGLRDLRFVSLALLCGILELYQPILTVGLPLWIIASTTAPAAVNSALLVEDTVVVFLFQVAMSRSVDTAKGSARSLRRSGILFAACCLLFALTQHTGPLAAVPLLLGGTLVLVLSFDDFIKTSSDPRHRPGVEKLWAASAERGDFYRKRYSGLYCVGCERFYTQQELTPDGCCEEHGTVPELVEENNWFFRLSSYQDQLLDLISSDRLRIEPSTRKRRPRPDASLALLFSYVTHFR